LSRRKAPKGDLRIKKKLGSFLFILGVAGRKKALDDPEHLKETEERKTNGKRALETLKRRKENRPSSSKKNGLHCVAQRPWKENTLRADSKQGDLCWGDRPVKGWTAAAKPGSPR